MRDEVDQRHGQHGGDDEALVHRAHYVRTFAKAHEIGAHDAGDDAGTANEQRQGDQPSEHVRRHVAQQQQGQHHGGAHGDDVGLEQVGGHAGAVAHVVTHVVRDHGGIAGIVLRNARFHLADKVRAHVRRLGEDAAAKASEDGDERGTEGQRHQRVHQFAPLSSVREGEAHGLGQHPVEHRNGQQRQACHQHAGDRARAESEGETLLQTLHGSSRRAQVGFHRDVHADEAGNARQDGPDHEAHRAERAEEHGHQYGDHDADDGDGGVLPLQIGLRAFLNGPCDFLHFGVARICPEYLATGDEAVDHGQQSQDNSD